MRRRLSFHLVAASCAVRAAIDSADQKFSAAFKASDATTAASFYEDNATSMPPNMGPPGAAKKK